MQRKEPPVSESADEETLNAMFDAIKQAKVSDLILSTITTLISVAYGKVELKEFDEAKRAIDAIDALLPLAEGQLEDDMRRDLSQAVTNLKLAYANGVTSSQ
jgi:hypothetical protein